MRLQTSIKIANDVRVDERIFNCKCDGAISIEGERFASSIVRVRVGGVEEPIASKAIARVLPSALLRRVSALGRPPRSRCEPGRDSGRDRNRDAARMRPRDATRYFNMSMVRMAT